ncbi:hypothetical protein FDECE_13980 [Fusarium decemcellulare]|nr:hypothetical protein FDECE_13980 [Fusarium decemcellulare]
MRGLNARLRQIATLATDDDPFSTQVRSCIELVRTCHYDLQHLIQIRNQHAPLLLPAAVERIDGIIRAAQQCHERVYRLVEKCRPKVHGGRMPLRSKMRWILADSLDFESQQPLLNCHHAAVLAELNFVRQVALAAPTTVDQEEEEEMRPEPVEISSTFSNIALLGDVFDNLSLAIYDLGSPSPLSSPSISAAPSSVTRNGNVQAHLQCSSSAPENTPVLKTNQVVEVHEKFTVIPFVDSQRDLSPYCDEKEVVFNEQPRSPAMERVVLNPQDTTGLRLLLDLEIASSPSPISQISSPSPQSNLQDTPLSNSSQINKDQSPPAPNKQI